MLGLNAGSATGSAMRESGISQICEGTNRVQRIVIARQLLAGLQSEL